MTLFRYCIFDTISFRVAGQNDDSDDEEWKPKEAATEIKKLADPPTEEELEEILTSELLNANDEVSMSAD